MLLMPVCPERAIYQLRFNHFSALVLTAEHLLRDGIQMKAAAVHSVLLPLSAVLTTTPESEISMPVLLTIYHSPLVLVSSWQLQKAGAAVLASDPLASVLTTVCVHHLSFPLLHTSNPGNLVCVAIHKAALSSAVVLVVLPFACVFYPVFCFVLPWPTHGMSKTGLASTHKISATAVHSTAAISAASIPLSRAAIVQQGKNQRENQHARDKT